MLDAPSTLLLPIRRLSAMSCQSLGWKAPLVTFPLLQFGQPRGRNTPCRRNSRKWSSLPVLPIAACPDLHLACGCTRPGVMLSGAGLGSSQKAQQQQSSTALQKLLPLGLLSSPEEGKGPGGARRLKQFLFGLQP